MPEAKANPTTQQPSPPVEVAAPVRLRRLWPVPALVLGVGLFVAGLVALKGPKAKVDPSVPLRQAEQLVESGQYQQAIDQLNGPARALIESPAADDSQLRRFHLARARAFAGAQQALGVDLEPNHKQVIADYQQVERLGQKLEPDDLVRLSHALVATGEIDEALSRIGSLPQEKRPERMRLSREVINHNLAAKDRREAMTLDLLAALANDPDAGPAERAWTLARQTELLLSLRRVEEAITKLLREMQRLRDLPPENEGELYVLLGQAYYEVGQPENAEKQLASADSLLDRSSLLRAEAALLLGRISQNRGERGLDAASERYAFIVAEFRTSRAYVPAVLGLAEIDAAQREFDSSLERYAEVVAAVRKGEAPREVGRDLVMQSLLARHARRDEDHDRKTALRYAQMAETLYSEREVPAPVLLALARTNRDLADDQLEQARAGHAADFSVQDLDPATRAEVKRHYLAAGEYYRRHAEEVAAADPARYAESLWTAADSLDRGGDLEEARKAFSTYADAAGPNDPNRPAAKFRLAQIFQAQGDFPSATAIYEDMRNQTADPNQPHGSGNWADRSIVPLAMCYLSDKDPDNDVRAETLLKSVVDGTLLSPDAKDFREALVQLGNMYYTLGRYTDSIVRYEEALERYGEQVNAPVVRFKLADSHRLEAQKIQQTLTAALPQAVQDELKGQRTAHLADAVRLYEQVRQELEPREGAKMPELERVFLRNAYFYAGDCAYEMADYEKAVAAYDAAALRYADDPASLVAMAQIVSAYIAQGQWAQARTANERARRQLARFPDEVWSRPDLPMEKRHWERWLDARTVLEREASAPTP